MPKIRIIRDNQLLKKIIRESFQDKRKEKKKKARLIRC
jgi:hypothetical protein